MSYRVIPNEHAVQHLELKIGRQSSNFANNLYSVMNSMMEGNFSGGLWELREYNNGAVAMVLPQADRVVVASQACQRNLEMSLEALSLIANSMLLVGLCEQAAFHGDEEEALHLRNLNDVLRDAVDGLMTCVLRDGELQEPTEADRLQPMTKHPESAQFRRFID